MARYQIRVPENQFLEDLVERMVKEVWVANRENFQPSKGTQEEYGRFLSHFKQFLTPYVETYDLCGFACECSDEIEGAPWLDYKDHIYHLVLPNNVSGFANAAAMHSLTFLKQLVDTEKMQEAFLAAERIYRKTLSEYLYYNPMCRKADICKSAVSVNPWRT